jgi:hypothetical protein
VGVVVVGVGGRGPGSAEELVDGCLDLIGMLPMGDQAYDSLIEFVRKGGPLDLSDGQRATEQRVVELLQLIVATREFQFV